MASLIVTCVMSRASQCSNLFQQLFTCFLEEVKGEQLPVIII